MKEEFSKKNKSFAVIRRSGRGRLKQLNGQLPHLPCRLREYSSAELRQCVVNRRKHGKATHAFFVGDSRIRQFVEVFLDVFRDLKFRIATFEGPVIGVDDFLSEDVDFLWTKYKREFEARSTELPDLRVDFYWTSLMGVKTKLALSQPYQNQKIFSAAEKRFQNRLMQRSQLLNLNTIQRNKSRRNSSKHAGQPSLNYTAVLNEHPDASFKIQTHSENNTRSQSPFVESNGSGREKYQNLKTFKSEPLERLRNISRMEKNKVPDIIFLGTGIWSLDHQYEFQKVFDEVTLDQIELLRPTLREVAKKTDVVWVMAPPISDNVFLQPIERILSSSVFNKYQEWITSAQMKAFNSEGIPVWDSLQPVAYASIKELPKQPRLLYRRSWDCADRVHTNNEAVVVAIHMILNYLCNEYLPPEDYCCHQTS
ncbi:SGNH hydrolase-type esterase domain [Trinorchestia longiramus]|nr:SGNH hydrolase-type esterase domain [Trinorchestia longiramus]